jgi:hypothetical protein
MDCGAGTGGVEKPTMAAMGVRRSNERTKGTLMIDHDNLEEFRDPQTFDLEALLFYNGLQIRSCYGNWQQEPLTATSRSMIYVCQRRV